MKLKANLNELEHEHEAEHDAEQEHDMSMDIDMDIHLPVQVCEDVHEPVPVNEIWTSTNTGKSQVHVSLHVHQTWK